MKTLIAVSEIAALSLSILCPLLYFKAGAKTDHRFKKTLLANVLLFFSCLITFTILTFTTSRPALAAEASAASQSAASFAYIGAALAVGMSGIGGGIAVATSASAALGAISENEKIMGKSLIFVGLSEGVCLYGFIVALMIIGTL